MSAMIQICRFKLPVEVYDQLVTTDEERCQLEYALSLLVDCPLQNKRVHCWHCSRCERSKECKTWVPYYYKVKEYSNLGYGTTQQLLEKLEKALVDYRKAKAFFMEVKK